MAATTEGLRERKKRATRDAIAARRDAACSPSAASTPSPSPRSPRAADVSEKTVFNHFPAKEDLVFAGGEERLAALIEAIRTRPPGTSVLELFRGGDARRSSTASSRPGRVDRRRPAPRARAAPRCASGSFLGWEREAAALDAAVAEATGADDDDLVPAVVARTLAWTHRLVFRAAFAGLLAGEDRARWPPTCARRRAAPTRPLEQGLAATASSGPRRRRTPLPRCGAAAASRAR